MVVSDCKSEKGKKQCCGCRLRLQTVTNCHKNLSNNPESHYQVPSCMRASGLGLVVALLIAARGDPTMSLRELMTENCC